MVVYMGVLHTCIWIFSVSSKCCAPSLLDVERVIGLSCYVYILQAVGLVSALQLLKGNE